MHGFSSYSHSREQLLERAAVILRPELRAGSPTEALRFLLGIIDLTSLEATDTDAGIRALCKQAVSFSVRKPGTPDVAAVCVYPPFTSLVKQELHGSTVKTACVAAAFPSGQAPLQLKLQEVKYALAEGAEEIDMVISRGKFLEEKYREVGDEIRAVKELCGKVKLKVILETGELQSVENVRKACEIALPAGADFLKTSTGKVQPAATIDAFVIMLDTILEFYGMTGKMTGIKAAGGIADASAALQYFMLVKEILGEAWLSKDLFRIGASRLAENIFSEL
jgi:deoxyribose-phosphate aldolase